MKDSDRWQWSDGFDDDAIFAEIVAHINDEAPAVEQTARPLGDDAARESGATGKAGGEWTDQPRAEAAGEGIAEATGEVIAEATAEPTTDRTPEETTDELIDQTSDARLDLPFDEPLGPTRPDIPDAVPAAQVWRAHDVDAEYEEHFEPPPIAPLPAGDLQFWAIIAGMGGGPLLLLYFVFFNRDASSYWMLSAMAMSIGGFALLVSRLPRSREDGDDGARL